AAPRRAGAPQIRRRHRRRALRLRTRRPRGRCARHRLHPGHPRGTAGSLTLAYPVSIKGVLLVEWKVLLVRNDRNEWELPGGRLENGATPAQHMARGLTR